jgi:hypothetical protein
MKNHIETALSSILIIDRDARDCSIKIKTILLETILRLMLEHAGVNTKKKVGIISPHEDESGNFTFSIEINGNSIEKKFEVINNDELLVTLRILHFYTEENEWREVWKRTLILTDDWSWFSDIVNCLF